MKGHRQDNFLRIAESCVLIPSLLLIPSCSGGGEPANCKDPGTLVEKYYGFGDRWDQSRPDIVECFGPPFDCMPLCMSLAGSEHADQKIPNLTTPVVCERVSAPDGWADAGYQGWEDAGYVSKAEGDGGVDPNRILHVVFRVRPFCGA